MALPEEVDQWPLTRHLLIRRKRRKPRRWAVSRSRVDNPIFPGSGPTLDFHSGTAQAGTTSTITLAAGASATDDIYNEKVIVLTGGTGSGQHRTITDYVGATKVATISPVYTTAPGATTTYVVRNPDGGWVVPMWEGIGVPQDVGPSRRVLTQTGTTVAWRSGELGPYLSFLGTNENTYFSMAAVVGPTYVFPAAFTLTFWFRHDNTNNAGTSTQYMFAMGTTQQVNSVAIYFRENTNTTTAGGISVNVVDCNDSGTPTFTIPAGFADGRWHHFILTRSLGSGIAAYIDGIQRHANTARGQHCIVPPSPHTPTIGAPSDASKTGRFFKGDLAIMALLPYWLTAADVWKLYMRPWSFIMPKLSPQWGYRPGDGALG